MGSYGNYAATDYTDGELEGAAVRRIGAGVRRTTVLTVVGTLSYVAAAVDVGAAFYFRSEQPLIIAIFLAAAVSALFFGGVSFAANDIRHTMRSIDAKLTTRDEADGGHTPA
jgi:hypothetical protein